MTVKHDNISERRAKLLNQRYGDQPKPETILWNDQIESLLSHKSVRNFLSDPLPAATIETMVAAAQSASTSSNLHQWSVVAITDQKLKSAISAISRKEAGGVGNPYIDEAPVLLLWIADLSRSNRIARCYKGDAQVHHHLDALIMATIDAALAAQNAAVAAESLNLGIVYIGAMRNQAREIAELIKLPNYSYIAFGMVVGKPASDKQQRLRPRPAQNVVLHINQYDAEKAMDALGTYENAFQDFREDLGMKVKLWAESVAYTANSMEYMHGRQHLAEALLDRGFGLL